MNVAVKHGQGNHLMIDIFGCKKNLDNQVFIKSFLDKLPGKIGMNKLSEPIVKPYGGGKLDSGGITGVILVSESHISIHTYPKEKYASIDVYSCKEFDIEKVKKIVTNAFESERIETNTVGRGLKSSVDYENHCEKIDGKSVVNVNSVKDLVKAYKHIGFQATHLSKAYDVIKLMKKEKATVFLAMTSNLVSSGLREVFAHITKNKLVDVIITSTGSIEEDIMKVDKPFLLGDFDFSDIELHRAGINRVGNIFIPDERYEKFEDFIMPVFTDLYAQQKKSNKLISPSALIKILGSKVNDENSFLYWASKNNIPVYCPGITDGAIGIQLYFFKKKHADFGIDVSADMNELANSVLQADKTGGIILGGGIAKHHTIGINILREGLDYAVYVSTAEEYDGSLSGAKPKEAKSWSKLKEEGNSVLVNCDATIAFPLLAPALEDKED